MRNARAECFLGVFVVLAERFEDCVASRRVTAAARESLPGEVVVEQGAGNACIAGDSAHGGAEYAASSEMFCSNFQNLLFAFVRFHAQGTGARSAFFCECSITSPIAFSGALELSDCTAVIGGVPLLSAPLRCFCPISTLRSKYRTSVS